MTIRVLLLAYEFPPLASSGVHRALGFARELPSLGFELEIVTVRPADYATWSSAPQDPALLERVPPDVRVHRIASGFPDWYWSLRAHPLGRAAAHYLHLGDPVASFWRRPLKSLLDSLIPRFQPQVLLATAPPFGVMALGQLVARQYRMPWVADWRDPWTHWGVVPFPTFAHHVYARRTEGSILASANISVATSPVTREQWLAAWPDLPPERVVTIYNGYDRDREFVAPASPVARRPGKRRIVHTGNFYYTPERKRTLMGASLRPARWLGYQTRREDWRYRSPYFFLRGLRLLAESAPAVADTLEVIFAGPVPAWLPDMLRETGTESAVQLIGPVSHAASLALQRDADALLLTSAKVEGARDYSVAGKLLEYFGARRPILGVLTDGAMHDLVMQSGLGILADPDDDASVARALARVATTDRETLLKHTDDAFLGTFDRRVTVQQMASYLRAAATEGYRAESHA